MKQNYAFLFVLLFAMACGGPAPEEATMPTDLAGLQAHLKEKKSALRALEQEINQIEELVAEKDPTFNEIKKFVSIDTVATTDFHHYVTVQGSVTADDVLNASSETGGRITKLLVEEGDYVKKGQLIAETDLETIDKQIDELQTSLGLATDVYDRQKRLWDQNIGSEVQFLQAKNSKERLEKSIQTLEFQKTKANVYAPIGGAIDMVFVKEGEVTSPGMPIVQVLNTARLKVEADAPENLLGSVRRGDLVSVSLPAINEQMKRRISSLGRRIDPSNRTFRIEVSIPSKGVIKPNLLAELELNDHTEEDVVVVPIEIVQQEISGKEYVIVLGTDEEGHFATKRFVQTGMSYQGQIVIEEGLNAGDEIVLVGGRGLTDGERIMVTNKESNVR